MSEISIVIPTWTVWVVVALFCAEIFFSIWSIRLKTRSIRMDIALRKQEQKNHNLLVKLAGLRNEQD